MVCGELDPSLQKFMTNWGNIHGYFCLIVGMFGLVTNVINIAILTRKSMRNSINCVLSGIAMSDLLTMFLNIIYIVHFHLKDQSNREERNSYAWMSFMVVYINLSLITHTVSIWLGVTMAVMRYKFVRPTSRGTQSISVRTSVIVIIITYVAAAILMIPNCLTTKLEIYRPNKTFWTLSKPDISNKNATVESYIIFWTYPVVGKIIPVTLIIIFGGFLLRTLRESDLRGRRLKKDASHHSSAHRRTTVMLLAIMLLYTVSEVPQSVLLVLSATKKCFFENIYFAFADLIDAVTLSLSAINFILYCTMSQQFRTCLLETVQMCTQFLTKNFRAFFPKPAPVAFV